MKRLVPWTTLLLAMGCQPDLGVCDEQAAQALVYDLDGQPAYEGQALIIQSCGSGAFCHSEGIEPAERRGAPHGLDFDLRLASQTPDPNPAEVDRLGRSIESLYYVRRSILDQVDRGLMPPPETDVPIGAIEYQRVPEGAREGPPLPPLSSDEGQDVLRNWLACMGPRRTSVVERTAMRSDGDENTVGDTHPAIETTPVEPVWSAIYPRIVERSCAYTTCHDAETTAGALDLSTPTVALASLRSGAAGRLCGDSGAQRVVPGEPIDEDNPAQSLLIHKLRGSGPEGRVCGSRMPEAGNFLSEERIAAIEQWIRNGANDD